MEPPAPPVTVVEQQVYTMDCFRCRREVQYSVSDPNVATLVNKTNGRLVGVYCADCHRVHHDRQSPYCAQGVCHCRYVQECATCRHVLSPVTDARYFDVRQCRDCNAALRRLVADARPPPLKRARK